MNFFISLFTENKLLHSFNVCGARFQTLAASILNVASSIAERLDSTKVVTFIDLAQAVYYSVQPVSTDCSTDPFYDLFCLSQERCIITLINIYHSEIHEIIYHQVLLSPS